MSTKTLLSVLVLFSLLTACQLTVAPPPAQPSGVDAVGTAVELTTVAKFTEMAGSVAPATPTFTPVPTATLTSDSAAPVSGPCGPTVTATVNANVRSGPGTAYDAVGSLMLGQTATIVGRNDAYAWWYIAYPGVSGGHAWIAASVVTSACVPSVVQVVAAPPLPAEEPVAASSSDDSDDDDESDSDGGGSSAQPDLVAIGIQIGPLPARKNVELHITVKVTNRGDAAAGSFTVQWWATHALTPCSWSVSSLAPGASKVLDCYYTYGGWNPSYDLKLVADSGNTVAESNEGNNIYQDTLNVHPE
ncbi:MAG: SH3 domain-containing protein [Anaerolineales bacterium]|nr:SH3 domain-containing protein [Anaerolineales bacterium]